MVPVPVPVPVSGWTKPGPGSIVLLVLTMALVPVKNYGPVTQWFYIEVIDRGSKPIQTADFHEFLDAAYIYCPLENIVSRPPHIYRLHQIQ